MREIKFRAWDKKTKVMREVDSISFHNKRGTFDYNDSNSPKVVNVWGRDVIEDKHIILHREAKEVELMQYTGKKDMNDIEGYHKDLWEYHGVIYTLEWDEISAVFYLKHPNPRAMADDHIDIAYLTEGEIIGNIFENSNLLEDKPWKECGASYSIDYIG